MLILLARNVRPRSDSTACLTSLTRRHGGWPRRKDVEQRTAVLEISDLREGGVSGGRFFLDISVRVATSCWSGRGAGGAERGRRINGNHLCVIAPISNSPSSISTRPSTLICRFLSTSCRSGWGAGGAEHGRRINGNHLCVIGPIGNSPSSILARPSTLRSRSWSVNFRSA